MHPVHLPPGATALRTELNGREMPGAPLAVETDLRIDRELVITYGWPEMGGR